MSPAKRLFQTLVLTLAATVAVFVGVGYLLADRWHVDTTRVIKAPPARVEPLLRDFQAWQQWSQMKIDLGNQDTREITGAPGTVGHRVHWRGAQGESTLTMTRCEAGVLEYEFHTRLPGEVAMVRAGRGRLTWAADGAGTAVTWHDEGEFPQLVLRWIGWFGALQEQVRAVQSTSLEGLQAALEQPGPGAVTGQPTGSK